MSVGGCDVSDPWLVRVGNCWLEGLSSSSFFFLALYNLTKSRLGKHTGVPLNRGERNSSFVSSYMHRTVIIPLLPTEHTQRGCASKMGNEILKNFKRKWKFWSLKSSCLTLCRYEEVITSDYS